MEVFHHVVNLRPAHLFTYVLAGIVYVGRALLAEYAIPTAQRPGMEDLERRFARVRDTWLCKATYSPMGYTLSLLLYCRKIAKETGSRLMVSWSKQGDLMYFMGKPIPMDAIRAMVHEMITDAETLLWTELMFKERKGDGDDVRFTIPLADVEDDLTQTQQGQSFVHTNSGLAGKECEMLEDLVRGKRRQEFLDKDGRWNWEGIRGYLKIVDRFRELFPLSAHMGGGAPGRGNELGGLRWVNGINRDRGVFVIDGEMVTVAQYHKSLAHFDSPKVIPRFLPPRVTQLVAMYDDIFSEPATTLQKTSPAISEHLDTSDQPSLPEVYMIAGIHDRWIEKNLPPEPGERGLYAINNYMKAGFFVLSPSRKMFEYYLALLDMPGKIDMTYPEQNLLNYAHRTDGRMPWKSLGSHWNAMTSLNQHFAPDVRSLHHKWWRKVENQTVNDYSTLPW